MNTEIFKKFLTTLLISTIAGVIIFVLLYVCGENEPIYMSSGFVVGMFI